VEGRVLPSASMEDRSRAAPRTASAGESLISMLGLRAHGLMKGSARGSSAPRIRTESQQAWNQVRTGAWPRSRTRPDLS
jgi:hypothetical protein